MTRPLVALDALLVRPRPTGVGRAILELTGALAARDRGYDFLVLATCPELFAHLDGRPGWSIEHCPGARGGTLRKAIYTQWRLPRLLRRRGVDLLHCLNFVAPLQCPIPRAVTVHDLGYLRFPATIEQPRLGYYRTFVPGSLRRAAVITCNSAATAADVRARFPEVADRVRVTPYATPSWVWNLPDPPTDRPDDAPFLFVGTLEPRKNLEGLLRAYASFRERRRDRQLAAPGLVLVGGRGWKDSALQSQMRALVKAGALTVHDYCELPDLWAHYRAARALVFPSLHEGFGFPILEAMAAHLPVLTSDRGAMAEVASGGAHLVDPDDQEALVAGLERLTDDRDYRLALARGGRPLARTWDWERTAETTVRCYEAILSA